MTATCLMKALESRLPALIAAIGLPGFATELLDLAGSLVSHDAAALIAFPSEGRPLILVDRLEPAERGYLYGDYLSGVYLLSPFHLVARGLQTARVARVRDIAPEGFAHSEYHRRYFARIGVADLLGLLLPAGRDVLFLSFSRSHGKPRFTRAETRPLAAAGGILAAAAARHADLTGVLAAAAPGNRRQERIGRSSAHPALTAREQEIVDLLLQGHSSRAAATALGISVETLRVHRRNIYDKLGLSSQAELFRWFLAGQD